MLAFIRLSLALLIYLLPIICSTPVPRYSLNNTSTRTFTPNEFYANYALMVQYKHANVSTCPSVWKYSGVPIDEHSMLFLAHGDMSISAPNDTVLYQCNYGGALHLLRSTFLTGSTLDAFENDIADDVDKSTVYNSMRAQLDGAIYYVSAGTSPPTCGGFKYFDSDEMFVFFDESDTVMLSVVAKIKRGGPRILTLPLVGNIRYMLTVRAGTTCIYRAESDVQQMMNDIPRLSDSPSPAPLRSLPSSTPKPLYPLHNGTSLHPVPTPAFIDSSSQSVRASASPPASPSSSVGTIPTAVAPPSLSPTPTPLFIKVDENPTETAIMSASHSVSGTNSIQPVSASPSKLPQASSSVSISVSPIMSMLPSIPQSPSYASYPFTSPSSSVSPIFSPVISPSPSIELLLPTIPSSLPTPEVTAEPTPSVLALPEVPTWANEGTGWFTTSSEPTEELEASAVPIGDRGPFNWILGRSMCFPASAKVTLSNGKQKTMSALKVGDHVLVGNGQFSKVMMFTHRNGRAWSPFTSVRIDSGTTLTASGGHYVYANSKLIKLNEVQIGDLLEVGDGMNKRAKVVSRSMEWHQGLFNPQTETGDIVVETVRASCYTEAVKPATAHSLLTAVRAISRAEQMYRLCLLPLVPNVSNPFLASLQWLK